MIIGVAGNAGSGKDTVADHLVRHHGFVKVALADPLKRICREVFDFSEEQLWGPSEKRNAPDARYLRARMGQYGATAPGVTPIPEEDLYLTPRHALQQLGTEWGRACYENIWVEYAIRVAKQLLKKDYVVNEAINAYHAKTGLRFSHTPYGSGSVKLPKGVVIPDVRFRNEVDAIRAAGGKVWRVSRFGAGLQGAAAKHQSETELDTIPLDLFTQHVSNNSTLEALYAVIDRIMKETS